MLTDETRARLAKDAEDARAVQTWLKQPAATLVFAEMDRLAEKEHKRWLSASPEEAEKIRQAARPIALFFDVAKRLIQRGELAVQQLQLDLKETSPSSEGQEVQR